MQPNLITSEVETPTVEYRDIPGFPGYRVGSDGSVWSCLTHGRKRLRKLSDHWHKLTPFVRKSGYCTVLLHNTEKAVTRYVHRLVLTAFVGLPPYDDSECRHFPDSTRTNNRLNNLSWGTQADNEADKVVHASHSRGERHGMSKVNAEQVASIRRRYAEGGISQQKLGREYGITQSAVFLITAGRNWKHMIETSDTTTGNSA